MTAFLGVAQPLGRKDSRVPLSSGCEARTQSSVYDRAQLLTNLSV